MVPRKLNNEIIFFKDCIYLLEDSKTCDNHYQRISWKHLQRLHENFTTHQGKFYWKNIRMPIKAFIHSCDICQCDKIEQLA